MSTTYAITSVAGIREPKHADAISNEQKKEDEEKLLCCLLEEDRLTEVFVDCKGQTLLGNIYVGKVKNILKNIDAAFVEIAGGRICFLPLSEARHPILTNRIYDGRIIAGDEILVQVQKDAVKTKDPVLTASISVTGKYASISLGEENGFRYSHKLSAENKAVIRESLKELPLPRDMTAVIRTQSQELCESCQLSLLKEELLDLFAQAQKLLRMGKTRTVFSLLTESMPGYMNQLQRLSYLPDKIITDDLAVFQTLQSYYKEKEPDRCASLCYYQDAALSLAGLYGLKGKLADALGKNVWLKSGGYLVIEPTEALTVIDVNTGRFTGKKNTEETFAMINEEAACEVARQLRLRNLSGIILVDFINMSGREANKRLLSLLREACRKDPVAVSVVDMTALGLVEITRKKVSKPLAEQLKELRFT